MPLDGDGAGGGRHSPAISLSSVLLPAPFGATSPVRPVLTVKDKSLNTACRRARRRTDSNKQ